MAEHRHDQLEVSTEVHAPGEQKWQYLAIRVRCSECGQQFSFRGLASGHPNEHEPVVTADGYELRAPIMAGPGATVGLLQDAGLEAMLARPDAVDTSAAADC